MVENLSLKIGIYQENYWELEEDLLKDKNFNK